jgi:hypothetical protein
MYYYTVHVHCMNIFVHQICNICGKLCSRGSGFYKKDLVPTGSGSSTIGTSSIGWFSHKNNISQILKVK